MEESNISILNIKISLDKNDKIYAEYIFNKDFIRKELAGKISQMALFEIERYLEE